MALSNGKGMSKARITVLVTAFAAYFKNGLCTSNFYFKKDSSGGRSDKICNSNIYFYESREVKRFVLSSN